MNPVAAALLERRMTRAFLDDPVARADVSDVLACGLRAPNAGFSQGWDFVVLSTPAQRTRYWRACLGENPGHPDAWLRGVSRAPVLIVCCSDPQAYLDRYAEPDKPWQDRDPGHWPIPYWDTDTAMTAYGMLLRAHELGLGALFFGVPGPAHAAFGRRWRSRPTVGWWGSSRWVGPIPQRALAAPGVPDDRRRRWCTTGPSASRAPTERPQCVPVSAPVGGGVPLGSGCEGRPPIRSSHRCRIGP